MNTREMALALVMVLPGAAFAFAACTSTPTPGPSSTATSGAGNAQGADPAPPTETSSTPPSNAANGEPETTRDCVNLVTDLVDEPPADGVAMNNAMTAGDAGASDRLKPILDTMNANRDGFRCCFDLWGKDNPGQSGKVAFTIELRPTGEVRSAAIKHEESDLHAKEVESCMTELANTIAFPESPTGKDTTYTHRFNFKAKQ